MPSQAEPVSPNERLLILDVIRGFALLGIFIMNMPGFNTSFFAGADGTHLWPEWWDRWTETLREVLFAGKFNSMFSMLFAVGFTIQLARLEEREPERAKSIYLRRIFWLFVLGVIHATVFWTGDVLHVYAALGLLLLALRRVPDKALWTIFISTLFYPVALGVYRLVTLDPKRIEANIAAFQSMEASNNAAYGGGSFLEAAHEHVREMIFFYSDSNMLLSTVGAWVMLFSTMTVGLILGRSRFFQNVTEYLPLVRRIQWWALGIGISAGVVFGAWQATTTEPMRPTVFRQVAFVCFYLGRICITAFYVATMIRAVCNERWRVRLMPMAIVGRMPLTNYLMQTLIATFLFYGWGLGYWGKAGPALDIVLAVAIFFVIQIPLSYAWLSRFSMGPMEYLWRLLTYGRASLRRQPSPAPAA
jgi:uncharacterized protein